VGYEQVRYETQNTAGRAWDGSDEVQKAFHAPEGLYHAARSCIRNG
jgi:hypothetical protein